MTNEALIVGATVAAKYRIMRIIGGGSMGVVCEAEHLEIGKHVAIKLIEASLAGMNDVAMRFRQEARATSLVESQHIVQVFDVGTDDKLGLYLVMEYLRGEDLAKALAREGRLPADAAIRIAMQVARGLGKAHDAGIVHRDLKPANIFLCTSESDRPLVKVLDFGVSMISRSSRESYASRLKLTRAGMVVGTPQYMSPEQAQGLAVDHRTDVWALGLVLYEMLAGRPAYLELPTYEQFIVRLVSQPPDPLLQVAPWVSEKVAAVVHGALTHDLTNRTQSCADLIRQLESAASDAPPRRRPRTEADRIHHSQSSTRAPITSETPHSSLLASSGVRGTAPVTLFPSDDIEEDAPQFFDRTLLRSFDSPRPGLADQMGGDDAMVEARDSSPREPSRPGSARRVRLRWAAMALAVLALAAAAALALR